MLYQRDRQIVSNHTSNNGHFISSNGNHTSNNELPVSTSRHYMTNVGCPVTNSEHTAFNIELPGLENNEQYTSTNGLMLHSNELGQLNEVAETKL